MGGASRSTHDARIRVEPLAYVSILRGEKGQSPREEAHLSEYGG